MEFLVFNAQTVNLGTHHWDVFVHKDHLILEQAVNLYQKIDVQVFKMLYGKMKNVNAGLDSQN